jgi:hypothetical protein
VSLTLFLIFLAIVSLGACQFVVRRLAIESPFVYVELDRPDLFEHNTAHTALLFWRWVYSRRPDAQALSVAVLRTVWFLRIATPAYVILLLYSSIR